MTTAKPTAATAPADVAARVREAAMTTAERLAHRLAAQAGRAPLGPEEIRAAFAVFRAEPDPVLDRLYAECLHGPRKPARSGKYKRTHAFERAMIDRFEQRFDHFTAEGHKLSRRVVIGFTYAVTKALTPEGFREFDTQARLVAEAAPDANDLSDNPQIRRIIDTALVGMARCFDDEFLVALKTFTDLINSRLSRPEPDNWDAEWELTRPLAVTMLDDLYANLRTELETGALHPAYGRDAAEVLTRFFAGLDRARKLADRPWLRKPLTDVAI